ELLSMDFLPFCAEDDKEFIFREFNKALSGEPSKFEAGFVSATGRDLYLEISLSPMRNKGQITGVYGIARDLTAQKQSEKIIVTKKNYLLASAALIESLLQNELTERVLHDPLALVGEAVEVNSIHYYLVHPHGESRENLL